MKAIVLGGGVIGVTTAYCLARRGHEVTLIERGEDVATETSFANAGLVNPGHCFSWADPAAPRLLAASLIGAETALRLSPDPRLWTPRMWTWGIRFLRNCTAGRNRVNSLRMLRLAQFSRGSLDRIAAETGVAFSRRRGLLYIHREARTLEAALRRVRLLSEHGETVELLDPDACVRLEPALAASGVAIAGALHGPNDESGDCRAFTHALARSCLGLGVTLRYATTILALERAEDRIAAAVTDRGRFIADAYVLALGSYSPKLARPLGLRLPIYPVKGYSLTLRVPEGAAAPITGGIDEGRRVAFARFGDSLRFTSTAEIAGFDTSYRESDFGPIRHTMRELFPECARFPEIQRFACLRPLTPGGPPILGATPIRNLFLNTGHGSFGWTMACGSAEIVAGLVDGRAPAIDLDGLALES
ncbi:MAG: D-amino acid dehydrogenase [Alphaproteobacteria bacterium]